MTGDGTTSTVLLIGEFLKQSELYITEGLHPRAVTEGFEKGKKKALDVLVSLLSTISPKERKFTVFLVRLRIFFSWKTYLLTCTFRKECFFQENCGTVLRLLQNFKN